MLISDCLLQKKCFLLSIELNKNTGRKNSGNKSIEKLNNFINK